MSALLSPVPAPKSAEALAKAELENLREAIAACIDKRYGARLEHTRFEIADAVLPAVVSAFARLVEERDAAVALVKDTNEGARLRGQDADEELAGMLARAESTEAERARLVERIEHLQAYANHERSLGAEGPMIELTSCRQQLEAAEAERARLVEELRQRCSDLEIMEKTARAHLAAQQAAEAERAALLRRVEERIAGIWHDAQDTAFDTGFETMRKLAIAEVRKA